MNGVPRVVEQHRALAVAQPRTPERAQRTVPLGRSSGSLPSLDDRSRPARSAVLGTFVDFYA